MRQHVLICTALLLLSACTAPVSRVAPAGMPNEVTAPAVHVGDSWRYAIRDAYTKLPRGTIDYRVSAVAGDKVSVETDVNDRRSVEIYTLAGNWIEHPATNLQTFRYSPPYEAFSFPLVPGKRWKSRVVATDPVDGRRFPVVIDGAVLGWERIRVPAGEFDTLKIRRYVFFNFWQQDVRGQSVMQEYEWYAPALKQAARREAKSEYLSYMMQNETGIIYVDSNEDGGGPRFIPDDWLVYELTNYSVR